MLVEVASIRLDGDTQPRAMLDEALVSQLSHDMRNGAEVPAILLFEDSAGTRWLVDGFHRVCAAQNTGRDKLKARIEKGERRDGFLRALELNAGKPLTPADRAACVGRMLGDPEWSRWSDREIARRCSVSPSTVAAMKAKLSVQIGQMPKQPETQHKEEPMADNTTGATVTPIRPDVEVSAPPKRKARRNGKTYEVNTENIGKGRKPEPRRRTSVKANAILKSAGIELDTKQQVKLASLATRMQSMVATRLKNGDSPTVADAVQAITAGAPVDAWGRAWEAIKELSVEDQKRFCRTVLHDLGEAVSA